MKHELNTDTEKTLNRREPRLAAIERKEHRGRVNREPRETISARQRAEVGAVRRPCLVKAVGGGKRWVGRWVISTLSGHKAGKWCSFSHLETGFSQLFPRFLTQVVDFPRICTVRLFSEGCEIQLAKKSSRRDADCGGRDARAPQKLGMI